MIGWRGRADRAGVEGEVVKNPEVNFGRSPENAQIRHQRRVKNGALKSQRVQHTHEDAYTHYGQEMTGVPMPLKGFLGHACLATVSR